MDCNIADSWNSFRFIKAIQVVIVIDIKFYFGNLIEIHIVKTTKCKNKDYSRLCAVICCFNIDYKL